MAKSDLLLAGWESRFAENGRAYFVDHDRKTITWLDPSKIYPWRRSSSQPDDLPNGWEISQADNGRTYFIDHNTRITTWEDPCSTDTHAREAPLRKPDDLPSGMEKELAQNGGTILEDPSLPNRPMTSFPLRAKIRLGGILVMRWIDLHHAALLHVKTFYRPHQSRLRLFL